MRLIKLILFSMFFISCYTSNSEKPDPISEYLRYHLLPDKYREYEYIPPAIRRGYATKKDSIRYENYKTKRKIVWNFKTWKHEPMRSTVGFKQRFINDQFIPINKIDTSLISTQTFGKSDIVKEVEIAIVNAYTNKTTDSVYFEIIESIDLEKSYPVYAVWKNGN